MIARYWTKSNSPFGLRWGKLGLTDIRGILNRRQKRRRGAGWWASQEWTISQASKEWGVRPHEWADLPLSSRYEILAEHRAKSTIEHWEALDGKERRRLAWLWREGKQKSP